MRYIEKTLEPKELSVWKEENKEVLQEKYQNESGKDLWKFMDSKTKTQLKITLMKEQGYLCCYCGKPLTKEKIHHVTIEHLDAKGTDNNKLRVYDYFNLLASCKGGSVIELHKVEAGETLESIANKYGVDVEHLEDAYIMTDFDKQNLKSYNPEDLKVGDRIVIVPLANGNEQHCNIKRDNKPVWKHPLQEDVATYFRYNREGEIITKNTEEEFFQTVNNLGLNDNQILNQDRKRIAEQADILLRRLYELYGADKENFIEKIKTLILKYESPDDGKLRPFSFVSVTVLEQRINA